MPRSMYIALVLIGVISFLIGTAILWGWEKLLSPLRWIWNWFVARLRQIFSRPPKPESPEEAEERQHREMIDGDDGWTPQG